MRQMIIWVAIVAMTTTAVYAGPASAPANGSEPGSLGLPPAAPATKPATAPSAADLAKLIQIDRENRRIVIEAAVALQNGPLEFVLCLDGTKDYESLLATKVPPSVLHYALLKMGLVPGKPARWSTPPGKPPVFLPPAGAAVDVQVKWTDDKGDHTAAITDWLLKAGKKEKADATRWVFVGSDVTDDGRYWADAEGHLISLSNFASSLLDVPFKSTDKNALLEFAANGDVVPAKGTAVKVILTIPKGQENAPVARVTVLVDAFGRISLDGAALPPENITDTAKALLAKHAQLAVDVRMDARSLTYDRERIKAALEEAGVTDVSFRMLSIDESALLPRTADQAARSLTWWKDQFAQAKNMIVDPADDAAAVLKRIEIQQKQLSNMSELWNDYAAQLRKLLADHKAALEKEAKANQ
jgi:hypothetical protein